MHSPCRSGLVARTRRAGQADASAGHRRSARAHGLVPVQVAVEVAAWMRSTALLPITEPRSLDGRRQASGCLGSVRVERRVPQQDVDGVHQELHRPGVFKRLDGDGTIMLVNYGIHGFEAK